MSGLSEKTGKIIDNLYQSGDAIEICNLLEKECSAKALFCHGWSPVQIERIHFAVLKLSKETTLDLNSSVDLAQKDWRDLLMSVGFADDLNAHEKWGTDNTS
tara:strand:- start:1603 stop:1908 length:306 start_codon:yes stop_codon:yes gene_type:complete